MHSTPTKPRANSGMPIWNSGSGRPGSGMRPCFEHSPRDCAWRDRVGVSIYRIMPEMRMGFRASATMPMMPSP